MLLVQIDLGYACAGVVVKGGKVVVAAPIFRWMVGKNAAFCQQWVKKKGGSWLSVEMQQPLR